MPRTVRVSPFLDYRCVQATFDAYTETGAAGGNMEAPEHDSSSTVASLGAEVQFDWSFMIPVFHAAYNHVSSGDPEHVVLTLTSVAPEVTMASDTVTIPEVDDSFGSVGLDLQKAVSWGIFHVGYTAEFGGEAGTNHKANVGLAFSF